MQEMFIDSIRVSLMNYQRVVILKERHADRYLPIRIGSPEADAIALKLQDVTAARPADARLAAVGDHGAGREPCGTWWSRLGAGTRSSPNWRCGLSDGTGGGD